MRTPKASIAVLIVTLTLAGGAIIAAQIHDHAPDQQVATPTHDRSSMHETLRGGMHARQAKLASLVKTMDGATGDAKIDTMAAIIRELVLSDTDMRVRMDAMDEAAAQKDAK